MKFQGSSSSRRLLVTACQSIEHAGEIRFGVEFVSFALSMIVSNIARGRRRYRNRGTEVLPRDGDAPQQSLRQIVVNAEAAVVDEARQSIPAAQSVCNALPNGVLPDSRRR